MKGKMRVKIQTKKDKTIKIKEQANKIIMKNKIKITKMTLITQMRTQRRTHKTKGRKTAKETKRIMTSF